MLFLINISILNYLYNPSPSHNTLGWPRTPLCYHSILFYSQPSPISQPTRLYVKGWLAQDSSVRRYPITIYKYKRPFFRRVLTQDLLTRMLTGEVNKYLQPQSG